MRRFRAQSQNTPQSLVPLDEALASEEEAWRAEASPASEPPDLPTPPGELAPRAAGAGWEANGSESDCSLVRRLQDQGPKITLVPYTWRDPITIPPRQWLYNRHYIRGYVSATIAPAGLGKSSLVLVEAVAMASGRPLLGVPVKRPLKVWVWNGEDPLDEIERRIAAIMLHYEVKPEEIAGRLFLSSGRTDPILLATKVRDNVVVADPVVANIVRGIKEKQIDGLIIDPFVSSHGVPENDNGAIDRVVKTWAHIADETGCAVELVHHVRKPSSGQAGFTVDDARGASALIGAARSARALNAMSDSEAAKAGVDENRRSFFRVDDADGKRNMMPPMEAAAWYRIVSVPLDNGTADDEGDWVGVVTDWKLPNALDGLTAAHLQAVQEKIAAGEWAQSVLAGNWAGYGVGEVLGIDPDDEGGRERLKTLLRSWIKSGALSVQRKHDKMKGRDKPMIVVGAPA